MTSTREWHNMQYIRDTFLDANLSYLKKLVKMPRFNKYLSIYREYSDELLFSMAITLINKVENGLVLEKDMELIELKIIIAFASMGSFSLTYNNDGMMPYIIK